jgi:hypothetical protein
VKDGCVDVDFPIRADGGISGSVTTADGKPASHAQVAILRVSPSHEYFTVATDERGHFEVRGREPGRYIVGEGVRANTVMEWQLRVYYPGVFTREQAIPIDLGEGEQRTNINFKMPPGSTAPQLRDHCNQGHSGSLIIAGTLLRLLSKNKPAHSGLIPDSNWTNDVSPSRIWFRIWFVDCNFSFSCLKTPQVMTAFRDRFVVTAINIPPCLSCFRPNAQRIFFAVWQIGNESNGSVYRHGRFNFATMGVE